MIRFNTLLAASAILAPATGQIMQQDLSVLSQNFRLIAHVKSPIVTEFAAGIENWEVAALPGPGCHEPLVLRRPQRHESSTNRTSGTTFFFNPTTTQVQSGQGGGTKSLFIPRGGHGERHVSMDCRQGTSGVGVAHAGDDGPQLVHASNGTFYTCPRRIGGEAVARLLYRQGDADDEPLPYACADVALFAKFAEGGDHGEDSLVVCCADVRDGVCVLPMQMQTGSETL
ncbi:hypothetical protein E4U41_000786 [Claviceps citrina]|nr:hypothetical protein E4U41_000786 [Claviceps citrina]